MKKVLACLLMLALALTMTAALAEEEKTYVIGMSQCNLGEPWRVAMNDQIAAAAAEYPMPRRTTPSRSPTSRTSCRWASISSLPPRTRPRR